MHSFSGSEDYRTWRKGLIIEIALTGGFDDVLPAAEPFASTIAEWQKACAAPPQVPEKILSGQLLAAGVAGLIGGVIALGLALFTVSVVRVGVGEAFGSIALFAAFSTVLALALWLLEEATRYFGFPLVDYGVVVIRSPQRRWWQWPCWFPSSWSS